VGEATVIGPWGGEVIADAPDWRVEILAEQDGLHATWSRFGPRREGADLHVHRRHHDLFYVLDGELTVRLGPSGEPVAAPAGTLVRVPPLVVHGYRNATDADVRFLNFHVPGTGFAAYLRALRDGAPHSFDQEPPPDDGGHPAGEASVTGGDGVLTEVDVVTVERAAVEAGAAPAGSLYVLEGAVVVDGREAAAGAWVTIPSGASWSSATRRPARVLSVRPV
jgi:quercetin dioxygenase-like cupin family protein